MAASRSSSRRATWSFWTRSVVRAKSTRHPFSIRARPMAAARWLFPPPGGPNRSKLAPWPNQPVAGGERGHLRLGDHRHGFEVEAVEGLSGRQPGLGEMTLDAASAAFGEFVFGDGDEEASGRPSFLVGLFGELRPHGFDGGQPQLVEQEAEARRIDGLGRAHAASPISA